MIAQIKEFIVTIIDTLDLKLQTKTGRISLLIFACIVFGGSIVHSYNMQTNFDELVIARDKLEVTRKELETKIDTITKNAVRDCNEQIRQGAILQQQLQYIYNNKIRENNDFIEEQKTIMQEKEELVNMQKLNIDKLKNLNQ